MPEVEPLNNDVSQSLQLVGGLILEGMVLLVHEVTEVMKTVWCKIRGQLATLDTVLSLHALGR
jgi:hypothetical protein